MTPTGACESASDDGRRLPATPPALGTPAPRRPALQAVGLPSSSAPRVRGSIPAARQLSPVRPSIVCAVCNSCSRRATFASSARTFASSGLRSPGFAPRFFGANSRSEPLRRALRQAVRWELYNPSRRSSRPTSPGCVQRSASSRIRSRYCAVNWRRFGLATTSGPGTELSFNVIGSLSAVIGVHLHRPTVIPKDAGVSVMLAEREGAVDTRPRREYPNLWGQAAMASSLRDRQWWRGGGLFRRKGVGETIVKQVIASVWEAPRSVGSK